MTADLVNVLAWASLSGGVFGLAYIGLWAYFSIEAYNRKYQFKEYATRRYKVKTYAKHLVKNFKFDMPELSKYWFGAIFVGMIMAFVLRVFVIGMMVVLP